MSCDAERITGYVDGALDDAARSEVEAHLLECSACRDQIAAEGALRARLREMPAPEPRPGLDEDVRRRLRGAAPSRLRWLLPFAAGVAVAALWMRGAPNIVAWELARDHAHCFGMERLPAEVWSSSPERVASWFQTHGTALPPVPAEARGLELVGGRYCPLLDGSKVAHLYYTGRDRHLSLFVLAHDARFHELYTSSEGGHAVRLMRVGGSTLGLVSEHSEDVEAFRAALTTVVAGAADDVSPEIDPTAGP
jgi:anti-sigma factor RsiW